MKRLFVVAGALLSLLLLALTVGRSTANALRLPSAPRCTIFPATNQWNQRVDSLPVAADSAQLIASMGASTGLHPDFGSGLYDGGPIGIPFDVVSKATPRSRVTFDYADESDKGPYPIPKTVHIEGGRTSDGDRHALLLDRDACKLYELYALYPKTGGGWKAGSGAIWNLRTNAVRPAGWTSADAAGLPIFPGLARYDEVARGTIDHALRFTASRTRRAYVYPARHYASSSDDPSLPRMGERVRLKAGVDISGYPRQARIVLQALKTYGMILADNGSNWYISGAPDPHWSNDALHALGGIKGSDFEVVDTSSLPHPGYEPEVGQRDLRGGEAAHAVHAAARRRRRAAEIDALQRRPVRDSRDDRAGVELAEVHRPAVEVATDEIAVVRLERRGAHGAAREDQLAEAGCEPLDLRLDRFGHVRLRAIRHVAVRPAGVPAVGRARVVPEARLSEQRERRRGAVALLALRRDDLVERSAEMHGRRAGTALVAPRDRPGERPVELERAGAVPEAAQAARVPVGQTRAAETQQLARRDVAEHDVRSRKLVDEARGPDLAAALAQPVRERIGDARCAPPRGNGQPTA